MMISEKLTGSHQCSYMPRWRIGHVGLMGGKVNMVKEANLAVLTATV